MAGPIWDWLEAHWDWGVGSGTIRVVYRGVYNPLTPIWGSPAMQGLILAFCVPTHGMDGACTRDPGAAACPRLLFSSIVKCMFTAFICGNPSSKTRNPAREIGVPEIFYFACGAETKSGQVLWPVGFSGPTLSVSILALTVDNF